MFYVEVRLKLLGNILLILILCSLKSIVLFKFCWLLYISSFVSVSGLLLSLLDYVLRFGTLEVLGLILVWRIWSYLSSNGKAISILRYPISSVAVASSWIYWFLMNFISCRWLLDRAEYTGFFCRDCCRVCDRSFDLYFVFLPLEIEYAVVGGAKFKS